MKDYGVMECMTDSESEVWEGMEGGIMWRDEMWCAVDEKSKGKGKEGCALLMSCRIWEGIKAHGRNGSWIVSTVDKVGTVKYACVQYEKALRHMDG